MIAEQQEMDPDTPIEQAREVVYAKLQKEKLKQVVDQTNETMSRKDFSRPGIALGTVMTS